MRLEDWQKFIESQFLDDDEGIEPPAQDAEGEGTEVPGNREQTQDAEPPLPIVLPFSAEESEDERADSPLPADLAARPFTASLFDDTPDFDTEIPSFESYLRPYERPADLSPPPFPDAVRESTLPDVEPGNAIPNVKERRKPRTRARHARNIRPVNVPSGLSATELLATIPHHVHTLLALERIEEQKEVAQFSYKRPFEESRRELIARLLDPILSLEETARLLNVCPTTVRRYTNRGLLTCYRKEPEQASGIRPSGEKETRQRRFRLSDVLAFLEAQEYVLNRDSGKAADREDASPANKTSVAQ